VCSAPVYPGHGMDFVRNDSKMFHFCSRRCNQLFKKRVNPRKVRWTKAYRRTKGKELAMDTTFEFEKQKNVPVKYDRELYQATIKAMKRIKEIQEARKKSFYFDRMKPSLKLQKMRLLGTIEKGKDLLVAPIVAKKRAEKEKARHVEISEDEKIEEVKKPIKSVLKRKTRKAEKIQEDSE
jgi:large subunit ribosomal protein L24e